MGNEKCEISIIVPVYNARKFLDGCIKSVLNQDYSQWQLILVDDGSRDGSDEICDIYAKSDSRIIALHKHNGGPSDAKNYGLKKAVGKYILFVDSDDYIEADACTRLLKKAEKTGAQMVIGHANPAKRTREFDEMEQSIAKYFDYEKTYTGKEYLQKCITCGGLRIEAWRTLYLKEFLISNNLFFRVGVFSEDEEFTPLALLAAPKIALSDCYFYNYNNVRTNSIKNSADYRKQSAHDIIYVLNTLALEYKNVTPKKLRKTLQNDICKKYIDCYCRYDLAYDPTFVPKRFKLLKMAHSPGTVISAFLFAISPKTFYDLRLK